MPVRVAAPLVASDALRAAAALSVALVAARADLVAVALFLLVLGGTMVPRALGVSGALDASFCGTVLLGAWAAELDWYRAVSWLDVVVHAAITGLVAVLAYAALVRWRLVQPGPGAVVVTVGLGAALSTLWEIGEWAGHTFLDGRIAVGYQDTVGDLAAGLTGALVAGLLLARGRLLAGSRS
ncbi:hypothetical protein [Cellulomonas sp. PhB143]|uniref:hypothetical protein n=1 Tax=Cellulomonas sp. PhB143 TaxID=2485186 RepID=UPI000F48C568|nr:hypothetical protein [Cellulomonas sp. PhB143]ROS78645.1 hypothetical protein EDF32_0545 [Cellulomonas sp. PhB143]